MKKINKAILITASIAAVVLVSGCSNKHVPDEYMVLRNAPLALPPDFYLTPGGPDSDLDEIIDPQELAKRALFGSN